MKVNKNIFWFNDYNIFIFQLITLLLKNIPTNLHYSKIEPSLDNKINLKDKNSTYKIKDL
jgi:hypothetical protein